MLLKIIILLGLPLVGYGLLFRSEFIYQHKLGKYRYFDFSRSIPLLKVAILSAYRTLHFFLGCLAVSALSILSVLGLIDVAVMVPAVLAVMLAMYFIDRKRNPIPAGLY